MHRAILGLLSVVGCGTPFVHVDGGLSNSGPAEFSVVWHLPDAEPVPVVFEAYALPERHDRAALSACLPVIAVTYAGRPYASQGYLALPFPLQVGDTFPVVDQRPWEGRYWTGIMLVAPDGTEVVLRAGEVALLGVASLELRVGMDGEFCALDGESCFEARAHLTLRADVGGFAGSTFDLVTRPMEACPEAPSEWVDDDLLIDGLPACMRCWRSESEDVVVDD